jgi:hypothetical protein
VTVDIHDTTPSQDAVSGYAIVGEEPVEHEAFVASLRQAFERAGFVRALLPESAALVLNLIDIDRPRPFRRKSHGTYVAALAVSRDVPTDGLRQT